MEEMSWFEKNIGSLRLCLRHHLGSSKFEIVTFHVTPIHRNVNYTTKGIFKVQGTAEMDRQLIPWSVILKVIQPESEEKDDIQHHNYWKREAFVNTTGLLSKLPSVISVPKCYHVEEQTDGTVWMWLEEILDDNNRPFSHDEWAFIARNVGHFNGCYISSVPLPDEPWICRSWLQSWSNACKRYAADPFQNFEQIRDRFPEIDAVWERYRRFYSNLDKYISTLNVLPRVLAHQDLSQGNMYISRTEQGYKLTLIDWQFMSISGVGEDLGKLYGVAMSQGSIQRDQYRKYKEVLFDNYFDGLQQARWDGDFFEPRYGFCISTAVRSVWEIPKLLRILVESEASALEFTIENEVGRLLEIVNIQMDCADEAEMIYRN